MKKRLLSILLIVPFVLSACGKATPTTEAPATGNSVEEAKTEEKTEETTAAASQAESAPTEENAESAETEDAPDVVITGGSPWINSCLKDNVTADTVTDPKDDFSLYSNKDWILENEIPDGHQTWSQYAVRQEDVQNECLELLTDTSLKGHDAELIQGLYNLYLDWDSRNAEGYTMLEDINSKILELKDIDQVTALMTSEDKDAVTFNISISVSNGLKDSKHYYPFVSSPSLILGDSAEYTSRTEYGDYIYNYRHDLYLYGAGRLGVSEQDAETMWNNNIEFETKLSKGIYTAEEQMSSEYIQNIYNPMSFDELCSMTSNYPLKEIMTVEDMVYDGSYDLTEPEYLKILDSLYTNENIDAFRSHIHVRYILENLSFLDKESEDFVVDTYNKYFGASGTLPDEVKAFEMVRDNLAAPLEKTYVSKYCSEEDRQRVYDICKEVIDTYKEMLNENEWLSDATKAYAIKKLDTMTINAAYPDKFFDYSSLDISGLSYYAAMQKIMLFNSDIQKSKIGKEVDKECWSQDISLVECNAYYSPSDNSINMICGMMGEPFYSSDMSIEDLYASLGAFWVGHEVSHGFDSNGSQFDIDGNLNNWWTEADLEEYNKRIKKLDDYLDTIVVFGDYKVTGQNVDTEMLADISGVQVALRMAAKVDDFDYDAFFTKYAQMNTSIDLYSLDLNMLQGDPHPINYLRSNVPVQQFEEFYETYDVKEGDNMYLAPEDRVTLW